MLFEKEKRYTDKVDMRNLPISSIQPQVHTGEPQTPSNNQISCLRNQLTRKIEKWDMEKGTHPIINQIIMINEKEGKRRKK